MIQAKYLIIFLILLVTLIFLISGSVVFSLIFALIPGLMYADFLRREINAREKEQETQDHFNHQAARAGEDDYRILGLKPGASIKDVRRVYKNLAAQFHPDTGVNLSSAQQKITEEAYLKIREAHDRIISSLTKR